MKVTITQLSAASAGWSGLEGAELSKVVLTGLQVTHNCNLVLYAIIAYDSHTYLAKHLTVQSSATSLRTQLLPSNYVFCHWSKIRKRHNRVSMSVTT